MVSTSGDKVVILPLQGGGKVAIPIVTPGVGEVGITIPIRGGGKVVTMVSNIESLPSASVDLAFNNGGESYIKFWIKTNLPSDSSYSYVSVKVTTFAETITWTPTSNYNSWTQITMGSFQASSFTKIEITTNFTHYGTVVYLDRFENTWDPSGSFIQTNCDFEAQGDSPNTDWAFTGAAEITTEDYYDGTHSLKLSKLFSATSVSAGDTVAVLPLKGGGKTIVPISKKVESYIEVALGDFTAGEVIQVAFELKTSTQMEQADAYLFKLFYNGGMKSEPWNVNTSVNWGGGLSSYYGVTIPVSGPVTFRMIVYLKTGKWVRFDKFIFWSPWRLYEIGAELTDGSFESGSFGDGVTAWKGVGNVRIIDTDAYDGTHCVEFYTA